MITLAISIEDTKIAEDSLWHQGAHTVVGKKGLWAGDSSKVCCMVQDTWEPTE